MKPNALKALRVAATLSILAGASGLLIAGTDLVTKTIIEQNRIANIKKNLSKVFPDAGFGDGVKLSGGDYLTDYYPASLPVLPRLASRRRGWPGLRLLRNQPIRRGVYPNRGVFRLHPGEDGGPREQ